MVKKHKKLTKKELEERRHMFVILFWVSFIVASVMLAYDYTLMLRGGWDDMNYLNITLALLSASIVFLLTILYIAKFKGRKRIIWLALGYFVLAGFYFCIGVIGIPFMWSRSNKEKIVETTIEAKYQCAGIKGVKPEYTLELHKNGSFAIYDDKEILNGFYRLEPTKNPHMNVWFGGEYENKEPYFFAETDYDVVDTASMRIFKSESVSRYCELSQE